MFKQQHEEPSDELMFAARMVSDDSNNSGRSFVLRMSMDTDEIKIWENTTTGFRGGFYYVSPHYRNIGSFDPSKAYLGSVVNVNGVDFELVDAPDSTLSLMEANPTDFPFSDLTEVMAQLRINDKARDLIRRGFEAADKEKIGRVLMKDVTEILSDPELNLNKQQIRTICRRFRFYQTERFMYEQFLECF